MRWLSPFSKHPRFINNSNRVARIIYRASAYRTLFAHALSHGVPFKELLLTQFPYYFRDNPVPPTVSIELTNICDLRCVYCSSPLGLRPRGYMTEDTFRQLLKSARQLTLSRVRLVGNGEATLHPRFADFVGHLARHVKFLSIVTNAQWKRKETVRTLVTTPFQLVEISIDGVNAHEYESSRVGGSYDTLIRNLELLNQARRESQSTTKINIRLMLRPSQVESQNKYMRFWKPYADSVMPQYVTTIKNTEYTSDIFVPRQNVDGSIPRCSLIFKNLEVKWTGQVLLCGLSFYQFGNGGLELGNINHDDIQSLWNSHIMKQFRNGHRHRTENQIEMCRGCQGI